MRLIIISLLLAVAGLFADPIIGIVLEDGSDHAVPYATFLYASGKYIGQADSRGHFELQVERTNVSILVARSGYDTAHIELQDYKDLMDMVVSLHTNVRELGQTKVHASVAPKWTNESVIPVAHFEDAAGMRFDMAEQLSQLPGASGQRDFSSELSYDGSRSEEVAYYLGGVRIPNMRHLDVGLPGNLSVINPHVLSTVDVNDQYGAGPAQQGLASAIQFIPDPGKADEFQARFTAGTTVREFFLTGPWLFWDAFTVSFRWLDPSMLQNMGEKFFTTFSKRSASCDPTNCKVNSSGNFSLSSYDLYTHLAGSDSAGAKWGFTFISSQDQYAIGQDTTKELDAGSSINIVQGTQAYNVVAIDYTGATGLGMHLGWVDESSTDTLSDTTAWRTYGDGTATNFIDGGSRTHTTYSAGADDMLSSQVFGGDASWTLDYDRQQANRTWQNGQKTTALGDNVVQGLGRLTWRPAGSKIQLGAGAMSTFTNGTEPVGSLDWEQKLKRVDGLRVFGNTAWRSDYVIDAQDSSLQGRFSNGASAKLGLKIDRNGLSASIHGFGRYYPDPSLPEPEAFWFARNISVANNAWVEGASGTLEWRTLHHFALQTNASTVYGEYDMADGTTLPWSSNVRYEMSTHLRIYPREDSLLSVIISHRAAWHRPLYSYVIDPDNGTRSVYFSGIYTDLYRTDVRINLDLQSKWRPLENARFYVEADNILSPLNVSSLQWLGTNNARERSVVTQDNDRNFGNGFDLVPFMANGMGLYVQFGIEANLGF